MNVRSPRVLTRVSSTALAIVFALSVAAVSRGDDGHDHPTAGPHGGSLIELGQEEYHAELMHDDETGTVTIYLLDGSARRFIAVQAPELLVNVRQGRKAEQFRLKAKPQKIDRPGISSRYELKSPKLVELLDSHDAIAQMTIKISGRNYVGKIVHNHDHEHGDHHGHNH